MCLELERMVMLTFRLVVDVVLISSISHRFQCHCPAMHL